MTKRTCKQLIRHVRKLNPILGFAHCGMLFLDRKQNQLYAIPLADNDQDPAMLTKLERLGALIGQRSLLDRLSDRVSDEQAGLAAELAAFNPKNPLELEYVCSSKDVINFPLGLGASGHIFQHDTVVVKNEPRHVSMQ